MRQFFDEWLRGLDDIMERWVVSFMLPKRLLKKLKEPTHDR